MGFTRYYTVNSDNDSFNFDFLREVKELFELAQNKYQIELTSYGHGRTPEITNARICVNGVGSLAHEDFLIDLKHPRDDFCKTNRKPYDAVVQALLILAEKAGYVTDVRSDGDNPETDAICDELLSEVALSVVRKRAVR